MINKKFRATERAIFLAYYRLSDYPTARAIAKKAGISRTTLYSHHKSPRSIQHNYKQYLLQVYTNKMKKNLRCNNLNLRTIFFRTLVFIHNNRMTFKVLLKHGHWEIITEIMAKLRPSIIGQWKSAPDPEKLFIIYQNEVLSVIEIWANANFATERLDEALNDIIFLTETAPKRLAEILEQ